MKKFTMKQPEITLQINGFLEDCPILRVTSKCIMLQYKDKTVCMSHANFNFMLLHSEVDWQLAESEHNDNNIYFLV